MPLPCKENDNINIWRKFQVYQRGLRLYLVISFKVTLLTLTRLQQKKKIIELKSEH